MEVGTMRNIFIGGGGQDPRIGGGGQNDGIPQL